jgi:hypothetical protein
LPEFTGEQHRQDWNLLGQPLGHGSPSCLGGRRSNIENSRGQEFHDKTIDETHPAAIGIDVSSKQDGVLGWFELWCSIFRFGPLS